MKKIMLVVLSILLAVSSTSALADGLTAGDIVTFGCYDQNLPGEAISWKVLYVSGRTAVLMSEKALECRKYDSATSKWAKSSLCKWLNGSFLANAFTDSERAQLISDADGNYVVIPTVNDMVNTEYGFSSMEDTKDSNRSAVGTSHATMNGLWTNKQGQCSYFTRTPANSGDVYQVRTNGSIGVATVERENVGVRPMIYMSVN